MIKILVLLSLLLVIRLQTTVYGGELIIGAYQRKYRGCFDASKASERYYHMVDFYYGLQCSDCHVILCVVFWHCRMWTIHLSHPSILGL